MKFDGVDCKKPEFAKCIHCSVLIRFRTKDDPTASSMLSHIGICKLISKEDYDGRVGSKKMKQTTLFH